jgi:hypothetical protein
MMVKASHDDLVMRQYRKFALADFVSNVHEHILGKKLDEHKRARLNEIFALQKR